MSSARIGVAAGERVAMVGGPLIDQLAVARRPGQQDPARAAANALPMAMKFAPPTLIGAEVARERIAKAAAGLAFVAKTVKEKLVQDHRVHRDQLFALEPIDDEGRRRREIEFGKLLIDRVEALHRAAVVVLVVADDQTLRHSLDAGGVAAERLHAVRHGRTLIMGI